MWDCDTLQAQNHRSCTQRRLVEPSRRARHGHEGRRAGAQGCRVREDPLATQQGKEGDPTAQAHR